MRPVLRPGATVLRRDPAHLQLGTEPGRAVVVRDSPGVQKLLAHLDGLRPRERVLAACSDRAAAGTLDELVAAGMVLDADEVRDAHAPAELAHLLTQGEGTRARRRLRRRARAGVGLEAAGVPAPELLAAIGDLLTGSGVGRLVAADDVAARVPAGAWRHALPPGSPRPDVVVFVGSPVTGPDTEHLVVAGTAHLALSLVDGVGVVGPFVRPGSSACVGCVDRSVSARDPAWPALVDQLRPPPGPVRVPPDLPRPRSRVLESAIATWAAREVLAHLAGDPVQTYGASLRLTDDLVDQVVHRWPVHPRCGCCLLA